VGQGAQVVDGPVELVLGLLQQRGWRGVRGPEQAQPEQDADEPLLGAVVEVAFEPAARPGT
jgi:hypothetical protein